VTDGWWGEGYDGRNGWAIKPGPENMDPYRRDREDSQTLYEILQDQVIPLYYNRGKQGYPLEWVKIAKRSMASILPRFNSTHMVGEYVNRFYGPAARQGEAYFENNYDNAKKVAIWKSRVRIAWPGMSLRRVDTPVKSIPFGGKLKLEVAVTLNGLEPDDVMVELVIGRLTKRDDLTSFERQSFHPAGPSQTPGEHVYSLELKPDLCGKLNYMIRAYPTHPLLTHPFEMGMMIWL
jgi:starch phosphorylase